MDRNKIQQKLQQIFDDVFVNQVTVAPALTADEVDEWDSLSHITLVVAIEKAFTIRFGVGEVVGLKNVGELMDIIAKHLQEKK